MSKSRRSFAASRIHGAARIRAEDGSKSALAAQAEADARRKVTLQEATVRVGGELVTVDADGSSVLDTLVEPDRLAADASRDRLDLLDGAGALAIGLDTADTIQAKDSLERMLAHQLATLHASSLKMAAQMSRRVEDMDGLRGPQREAANVEACRLAGAVAKMSGTFQQGMLTLQRARSGGRQVVTVQHVYVHGGGQAVVAGQVASRPGGSPGRGEGQS